MTRFARPAKKTSLEATPWHELVNSGGNQSSTTASKDSLKRLRRKLKSLPLNERRNSIVMMVPLSRRLQRSQKVKSFHLQEIMTTALDLRFQSQKAGKLKVEELAIKETKTLVLARKAQRLE